MPTLTSVRGIALQSGHSVQVDARSSSLRISNSEGRIELTVRCTERGCVLEFASAEVALTTPGKLAVECDELSVHTNKALELSTEGDWVSRVAGSSLTQVAGRAETHADELELVATRGDAVVRANDFVRLIGEKIKLNSEQGRETTRAELEAFWKLFGV